MLSSVSPGPTAHMHLTTVICTHRVVFLTTRPTPTAPVARKQTSWLYPPNCRPGVHTNSNSSSAPGTGTIVEPSGWTFATVKVTASAQLSPDEALTSMRSSWFMYVLSTRAVGCRKMGSGLSTTCTSKHRGSDRRYEGHVGMQLTAPAAQGVQDRAGSMSMAAAQMKCLPAWLACGTQSTCWVEGLTPSTGPLVDPSGSVLYSK
mmetsp:Transcript_46691/g.117000  ORF Transcript_46691/g.117000 Transcript_46691/m.117000 type:complete len:204 (-) Transcript_46691:954-1565(-)